MGWLRKLFAAPDIVPRYGRETEVPPPIDWIAVEDRLVRLAAESISRFARDHTAETFYGLGFDCTAERGEVLICLNTRADQLESARDSLRNFQSIHGAGHLETVADENEWGFGYWRYHGINLDCAAWDDAAAPRAIRCCRYVAQN